MTPRFVAIGTLALLAVTGCAHPAIVAATPAAAPPARAAEAQDSSPKADLRLVPAEAYVRTYLQLFGGLDPITAQQRARGGDGGALFDTWEDYLAALGFPDYRLDLPRATQTNGLMMAAFERLGDALCDRAIEHDLKGKTPVPVSERLIFAFDVPKGPVVDLEAFTPRFDVLHRTFLSYPARLAPTDRTRSFFELYTAAVARHAAKNAAKSRFTPAEDGWAVVCYGLVRHPEFHLY
ncbi:MAG: hypothetical protein ABJE95_06965 [Byssovorax sp.]